MHERGQLRVIDVGAVGGSRLEVNAGQGLEVPPGVPHQFMNESQSTVTILIVSSPHSHRDRTNK